MQLPTSSVETSVGRACGAGLRHQLFLSVELVEDLAGAAELVEDLAGAAELVEDFAGAAELVEDLAGESLPP